ncbi:IclR family transcriptional regulator [Halopelagius longus]|nr:IclR family transcriptional regulator [Halopelagius longus]SDR08716.1 transcriptional regulator, IclR family [Halopelagius longus]
MADEQIRIKSIATCFRIVEQIQADGSAGISELAREVGLSKSAVYKHVQTLCRLGYLVREGDEYHLSLKFLMLGTEARKRLPLTVAERVVTELAETTGHTTNFIARENDRGIYALRVEPEGMTSKAQLEGKEAPLHATAGGKSIFAYLDEDERDEIIERTGLEAFTDKTITDRAVLDEELQSVRDKRVAFDREEFIDGVQCVASPVLASDHSPIGSVSVTGNIQIMSGKRLEEEVVGLVVSAAKTIEKEVRTT